MYEDVVYPIAELFVSVQGEGRYTGTLMQFIRFGGCSVGKPFTEQEREEQKLPIYQEKCTIWDGRTFACDTDYRVKERKTVKELVEWADSHNVGYVLLTGGEPLMRDITPLLKGLKKEGFEVHVETSGTIRPDLNKIMWKMLDWIAVSPKFGFKHEYADLNIANEFKLLVDEHFDWDQIPDSIKRKEAKILLSPVNDEKTINWDNTQRCIQIQQEHPLVKVTTQMHKLWGVR